MHEFSGCIIGLIINRPFGDKTTSLIISIFFST